MLDELLDDSHAIHEDQTDMNNSLLQTSMNNSLLQTSMNTSLLQTSMNNSMLQTPETLKDTPLKSAREDDFNWLN